MGCLVLYLFNYWIPINHTRWELVFVILKCIPLYWPTWYGITSFLCYPHPNQIRFRVTSCKHYIWIGQTSFIIARLFLSSNRPSCELQKKIAKDDGIVSFCGWSTMTLNMWSAAMTGVQQLYTSHTARSLLKYRILWLEHCIPSALCMTQAYRTIDPFVLSSKDCTTSLSPISSLR